MKTAICAIIKDEHLFLEEWIEWHLGLGFDAIHLFEDKGSKSHEKICAKYSNVYLRRYENDEQVQKLLEAQGSSSRQHLLYDWFAREYKDTYDWAAFIDLDEFMMFSNSYNLFKLCEEFEPYSAVLLNWRMMGASGRISKPTCGVIEAYTRECNFCGDDYNWAYKSFVNLKRFQGFHDLHLAIGYVNTHHNNDKDEHYYDKAWLNHYFTKSLDDWTERIFKKGGTQNGHRKLSHFFECNPEMKYLEKLYIEKHTENIPKGSYWLGDRRIAGGNIQKISLLNCSISYKHITDEERLELAIQESLKYGFEDRGRDKLVHIIWLGKKKFPDLTQKCMESWKKYLTNQTLCIWTEDSINLSHDFVKTAYENKSWAFASDYLRLWAIHKYGGVYIDTDVELIKPIDDLPTNFIGIERGFNSLGLGLMFGAEKGNEVIYDMMSMYNHFFYDSRKKDDYILPNLTTAYFNSRGYIYKEGINDFLGFTIFPPKYFSPINWFSKRKKITPNTYSIHHYMASWHDKKQSIPSEEDMLNTWIRNNSFKGSHVTDILLERDIEDKQDFKLQLNEFPLVSIVMPIYNRIDCVGKSILSVLGQSYPNIELIIADDGSTDGLEDYVKKFDENLIKYHKCKHNFIKTLNTAYKHSTGKYIARLDAGDVMSSEKIYQQVLYLETHQDLCGCLSKMSYRSEILSFGEQILKEKHVGDCVPAASFMFRREVLNNFSDIVVYPEYSTGGEDIALLNTMVHVLGKKIVTLSCFKMNYYSLPTSNPSDWKWDVDDQDIQLLEKLYNKYR